MMLKRKLRQEKEYKYSLSEKRLHWGLLRFFIVAAETSSAELGLAAPPLACGGRGIAVPGEESAFLKAPVL
jgi:hypothetical protein